MDHDTSENTNSGTLPHADLSPPVQHVEAEAINPPAPADEGPTAVLGEQAPETAQQHASVDETSSQDGGSSRLEVSFKAV
jgi:hypothetical protein